MKIAAFSITAIINLGIGVVLFFMLLLSLNGFSGKQAEPGIILFIVWALLFSLVTAALSFVATGFLVNKKSMSAVVAALISVAVFVVAGGGLNFLGLIVSAIFVSELKGK